MNFSERYPEQGADFQEPSKISDCFNGAMLDNYMWSQTGTDVDVRVPVDRSIKGKDIIVNIQEKHLKVQLNTTPGILSKNK